MDDQLMPCQGLRPAGRIRKDIQICMAALDEDTTKGCSIKINGMFSVQKIDFWC